jgi:glutamate-1-semialdehyde 2,1-aminomutase
VLVLPYDDPPAAAELIAAHADELAAVIVEPFAFSSGGGIPAGEALLRALRAATAAHGIALIFDEVFCAYRFGLGGMAARVGVVPDLAAVGKALGGGLPLAAFGGRAELMEAAFSGERRIFQSGTFTENPLSIAAGLAVLDVLESEPVLARADATGAQLREGLAACFHEHGATAAVTGEGSVLQVHLGVERVRSRRDVLRGDAEATRAFLLGMLAQGVLWPPVHPALTSGASPASSPASPSSRRPTNCRGSAPTSSTPSPATTSPSCRPSA